MKEIQLTHGKVAVVDDEDYDMLMGLYGNKQHKPKRNCETNWYYHRSYSIGRDGVKKFNGCAAKRINKQIILMHRVISGAAKWSHVHHVNGDPLDNRRCNIVEMSQSDHLRLPKRPHKDQDTLDKFSNRLRECRAICQLSQTSVSTSCGWFGSKVSRMESGEHHPTLVDLVKLSIYFRSILGYDSKYSSIEWLATGDILIPSESDKNKFHRIGIKGKAQETP